MAKRVWRRLTPEVRSEVFRLWRSGLTQAEAARAAGVSAGSVCGLLRPMGGVVRGDAVWEPRAGSLRLEERIEIAGGLAAGRSLRSIAAGLGRAPSTVKRELDRNGGAPGYSPAAAHRRAFDARRRPKPTKLAASPALLARVEADLLAWWSPQQIRLRLRREFGHDPSMQISHETVYKSLFVQGRGELRRELAACLRSGRAARRPRARDFARGPVAGKVMVSERPAEAEDRAVPGHWEGDLVMGAGKRSAIGTLVERSTRFVILLHLPNGRGAEEVRGAMAAKVLGLPAALRRSITWDQGSEMAQHARFTVDTGVPVYFCDPHSPWQRGTNENTNGLLRQYFPKGESLRRYTAADLDAVADSLNSRPRQTLDGMTPSEKLAELVALTG